MLPCQITHIRNNYVQLIKNTTCHVGLLTRLHQEKLLSAPDAEIVQAKKTASEQCKKLYEILQTKVGAFEKFTAALIEENQTGAVEILQCYDSTFVNYGLISINKSQHLGKGRSGTKVFKGRFDGREVAVKVIKDDFQQAVKEVDLLKKLDCHEKVVRYFFSEHCKSKEEVYIAFELCFISLQDEIKLKILNPEPIMVLRKCTDGVAFLHAQDIVHRDLKPANILLNHGGQVKVSDFGFSKQLYSGLSAATASGVYGTLEWMAPEILEISNREDNQEMCKITKKADVFLLGCVYYFVMTNGRHPFGLPLERSFNILRNLHDVGQLTLTSTWKKIILQMVAKKPAERPSTEYLRKLDFWKTLTMKKDNPQAVNISTAAKSTLNSQSKNETAVQNVSQNDPSRIDGPSEQKPIKSFQRSTGLNIDFVSSLEVSVESCITSNLQNAKQFQQICSTSFLTDDILHNAGSIQTVNATKTQPETMSGTNEFAQFPKLRKLEIWDFSYNNMRHQSLLTVSIASMLTDLDLNRRGKFHSLEFLGTCTALRRLVLNNVLIFSRVSGTKQAGYITEGNLNPHTTCKLHYFDNLLERTWEIAYELARPIISLWFSNRLLSHVM